MAKKQTRSAPTEDADFDKRQFSDFARAVINFYDHKLSGEPLDETLHAATRDRWNEVYSVATGLLTLRKLADREYKALGKRALSEKGSTGLPEAFAMLDALTTGTSHPVFTLIAGLQSKYYRKDRMKYNEVQQSNINGILAIVRTLMIAARRDGKTLGESKAIRRTVEVCKLTSRHLPRYAHAREKTSAEKIENQIRGLNRRWKNGEPDEIATYMLHTIETWRGDRSVSDCVLEWAKLWAEQTFRSPLPPVR
jgi:hypothetical protein